MATIASYPKGFSGGVSIAGMPILNTYATSSGPANNVNSGVYWVDSVYGAAGNPGTYVLPVSTVARALALAKPYDIIMVKPGHTETLSAAGDWTMSVAGVSVIGLGVGAKRPVITLGTVATTTINVTAASVSVQNMRFVANFADVASVFTLTTAKDFTVTGCDFLDTSSILNFLSIVTTASTANAADGLTFVGNNVHSLGTTAATTPIILAGNADRVTVSDNYVVMALLANTSALIAKTSKVTLFLKVLRNFVSRPNTTTVGGFAISTTSTTDTGIVADNYFQHLDTAAALLIPTGTGLGFFNNMSTGEADKSGFVLPAIADDA